MKITPKKIKCITKCVFLILITTSFGIISVAIPISYLFRNDGTAFDFAGLAGLAGFATIYYGIVTKRELNDLKDKPEEDCAEDEVNIEILPLIPEAHSKRLKERKKKLMRMRRK